MDEQTKHNIGILAFGSLIDDLGKEIADLEKERFQCETPFPVEFARSSSSRGGAPTLIPFEGGREVKAFVIVLNDDTEFILAKDILYRREIHKVGNRRKTYQHIENPTPEDIKEKVRIMVLPNFKDVRQVLYVSLGNNIEQDDLSGENLADLAIKSIKSTAGRDEKDGVRYLLKAKLNGIITELSDEYENQILAKTETKSLEEAIEKLDRQRLMYP